MAGFAAAAFDIEGESAGFVASGFGFGHAGEPVADWPESAGIRSGVGTWCAANRRLVDIDALIEKFDASDVVVLAGELSGLHQPAGENRVERVDDQRAFAGAGNTGDTDKAA